MNRVWLAAGALALTGCTHERDFASLYRDLHPSVVYITMRAPSSDPHLHGKLDDAYGTALVIESGPWGTRILTAKHVIDDARDLRARVADATVSQKVRIVALDRRDDLALLEVEGVTNASPVAIGDSDSLVPGQSIGLIGYPIPDAFQDEGLGTTASIYTGHVASIRAKGTADEAIELDLPIIPGESGAPVFTTDGKVVGIAESRFEEEHAIGFATPMRLIDPFLKAHRHRP